LANLSWVLVAILLIAWLLGLGGIAIVLAVIGFMSGGYLRA
jgi:hypothetical protein